MNHSSGLRTVFFGTPEFAAHILKFLLDEGENIAAVVTIPDKEKGRGLKVHSSAVKEVAEARGIRVLTPLKLRDDAFRTQLEEIHADAFCVVAFKILPSTIFTLPTKGAFNVHASLLPKYRGAAPINWAIIRGEKVTGITTFFLQSKVDTGGILLQEALPIAPDETAGELHDDLMQLGSRLAQRTLMGIADGSLKPQMQSETEATTAPKIFPADCVINFGQSAKEVHDFIRGLSPHPGAVCEVKGTRLKLLRSRLTKLSAQPDESSSDESHDIPAGMFRISHDGMRLYAGTSTSAIEILELQREGRSPMRATEFLRGARSLFE